MASNSATVNVNNRSSTFSQSNQKALDSPNRLVESEFKREFPVTNQLSDNTNRNGRQTLYRIEVAGQQAESGGLFEREQLNKKSSKYIYGNYWQVSLPVYSLATFEAQQLMQMDLQGATSVATSSQGSEAYSSTQNNLEQALVEPNDQEPMLDEDQVNLTINIMA